MFPFHSDYQIGDWKKTTSPETMNHCLLLLIVFPLLSLQSAECRSERVKRIVGGVPAEEPEADEPIVFVRFAGKTAKVTGVRDFPHYVFRGIRYADKPEGKYRFQVKYLL